MAFLREIPECPRCRRGTRRFMFTYDGETVEPFVTGDPSEFLERQHLYFVCLNCMRIY